MLSLNKRRLIAVLLAFALLACCALGMLALRSVYHSAFGKLRDIQNAVYDVSNQLYAFEAAQSAAGHELKTNQASLMDAAKTLSREYLIPYPFDYSWAKSAPPLIAHACGGVDGKTYTNSREALEQNYALGHRLFEIDFDLTETGALIASHDENTWRSLSGADSSVPYSFESFQSLPLCGQYEPLDFSEVAALMAQHPDLYVITDTKYTDKASVLLQFAQMARTAQAVDPSILNRIIPQIYNEEMLEWVMDVYPFKSVIFTLYNTHWTPESVRDFCRDTGVRFITLHKDEISQETLSLWREQGVIVGAHTSSDYQETAACFEAGVQFMYTDFLTSDQFQ